ncbi:hypothetical protein Patl1_36225 [Pistacia atlantica]|nr:hypothetical protein Patl1_36225 [Pistacia atlantica]
MTDQRPCFYKIICDEEPEPMKKFPRQFLKYISKELSDTTTLRVVSGGLWTVKVKIIGNDVFMEGWLAGICQRGRLRKNPVDTLNRQYTSSNSYDESLADQSHKKDITATGNKFGGCDLCFGTERSYHALDLPRLGVFTSIWARSWRCKARSQGNRIIPP